MKIYCSRHNLSEYSKDDDWVKLFNDVVGEDIWILCRQFDGISYSDEWVQIEDSFYEEGDECWIYDISSQKAWGRFEPYYFRLWSYQIHPKLPLETLTTEELRELLNQYGYDDTED